MGVAENGHEGESVARGTEEEGNGVDLTLQSRLSGIPGVDHQILISSRNKFENYGSWLVSVAVDVYCIKAE